MFLASTPQPRYVPPMLWSLMESTTLGVDGNGGSNVTWGSRGVTVPTSTIEGWNCCADAISGTTRPMIAKHIPNRIFFSYWHHSRKKAVLLNHFKITDAA